MENSNLVIRPCGDHAITVTLSNTISVDINQRVQALSRALAKTSGNAIVEMIPSYCALVIDYRPDCISYLSLAALVEKTYASLPVSGEQSARLWRIPCCYQRRFAPDLEDTAALCHMTAEELIHIHSSSDYRIYMLGFLPGFPYLGGMDERIAAPRLKTPRTSIPAGSVGIGGSQTGIYPIASPGGWRLIGQTPLSLYDPDREDAILCLAGDYIHFEPITTCDFYDIRRDILHGLYRLPVSEISLKGGSDGHTCN